MLTIFATPKPFRGHIAVIQRNAIRSWMLLRPACNIILFGDEEGTAEVASEFGVRHVPEIACNEYGTPLVNDLFARAERLTTNDLLCYVNADIILMSDFTRAVERVALQKRRFLMVGQRWNVDLKEAWNFRSPDWEAKLCTYVQDYGDLFTIWGIDYFVFPPGLFGSIPPFAIGRPAFDNWLIYRARKQFAAVVDATPTVTAVHQNHDYGQFDGFEGVRRSPEGRKNLELAADCIFSLGDVTHVLQPDGLKIAWMALYGLPQQLPIMYPYLRIPVRVFEQLLRLSHPVRSSLGLTLSSWSRRPSSG